MIDLLKRSTLPSQDIYHKKAQTFVTFVNLFNKSINAEVKSVCRNLLVFAGIIFILFTEEITVADEHRSLKGAFNRQTFTQQNENTFV